ncbi:MAG: hypothetical protein QXU98_04135 [Candidatus Parvarchaeota archaeon]
MKHSLFFSKYVSKKGNVYYTTPIRIKDKNNRIQRRNISVKTQTKYGILKALHKKKYAYDKHTKSWYKTKLFQEKVLSKSYQKKPENVKVIISAYVYETHDTRGHKLYLDTLAMIIITKDQYANIKNIPAYFKEMLVRQLKAHHDIGLAEAINRIDTKEFKINNINAKIGISIAYTNDKIQNFKWIRFMLNGKDIVDIMNK